MDLYYVEKGIGPPLVLLHGNGESHAYFAQQIEAFSKSHRVIAVDTRGHGQSPRGSAPFTPAQFANDLAALLDTLQLGHIGLLGFSDGANIALLFALQQPQRVRALVLNGGNLDPTGVKRSVQLPIELGYRCTALLARFSQKAAQNHELLSLMVEHPRIPPEALAALAMPVLVVAGTRDMILEQHTRLIAGSLPNAELALLPGDHFIAAKNSVVFNHCVLSFLKRNGYGFFSDK